MASTLEDPFGSNEVGEAIQHYKRTVNLRTFRNILCSVFWEPIYHGELMKVINECAQCHKKFAEDNNDNMGKAHLVTFKFMYVELVQRVQRDVELLVLQRVITCKQDLAEQIAHEHSICMQDYDLTMNTSSLSFEQKLEWLNTISEKRERYSRLSIGILEDMKRHELMLKQDT